MTLPLDPSQQDVYTIEWQRGRSDKDLDGNAIISLYYTGVDPTTVNYSARIRRSFLLRRARIRVMRC